MDLQTEIINNYKASCRRYRMWSIVLVVISFIIFTTFWNSRLLNWNMETIRYLKVVERYQQDPESLNMTQEKILERALDKYGEEFVMAYEVENVLERLYNQTAPFAYVEFPLLGIRYHINDIGIISGWILVIILLASYISAKRKHENLLLVVDSLNDQEISHVTIKSQYANSYHLLYLRKLPFILPVILLILILINDILTKDLGLMISPVNMQILFISSLITVALSILLASANVSLIRQDFRMMKKLSLI